MKNVGLYTNVHAGKQSNEPNWTDLPLFSQNVAAPSTNAVPQTSDLLSQDNLIAESSPEINAEPRKPVTPFEMNSSPLIADATITENLESSRRVNAVPGKKGKKENAAPHSQTNAVPHKTKKVKSDKVAKLPKSPEKKIRSQKRDAVPLKAFASLSEKAELENRAKNIGCSLSNYIRLQMGLPLNETGRKKRKAQAAFDLDELNLEE